METFSKLQFSGFKNIVTKSVFGELQFTQIPLNFKTSCCNLKIELWEQNCVWLFYYFKFKRNYDVLKSKSSCILLNKNINFNNNETESKTEKPTHSFRETNLVPQLIKESQIKSKTVICWSARKKKEDIFCTFYFVRRVFFQDLFYLSI